MNAPVWWSLAALVGAVLGGLAVWLHVGFWVRRLSEPTTYDEFHRVATADGCAIELRRLQPTAPSNLPPVVMVHGLAVDHRNFDSAPGRSFARMLRARGRDVWLVTLRTGRRLTRAEHRTADFAALAQHDVPTAVQAVRERTGAARVDYVGFSMGGIVLYATLGRALPTAWLRRAVTIGSPGRIGHRLPIVNWTGHLPRPLLGRVPLRFLSRLVACAGRRFPTPGERLLLNCANASPAHCRQLMVDAVADLPGPLLHDFARWSAQGGRIGAGTSAALDGLGSVDTPVLFVVGAADWMGFPAFVELAHDAWGRDVGGVVKRWWVRGRATGCAEDYGHCDLAMGVRVEAEVHAPIADWLAAADPAVSELPGTARTRPAECAA
ncbi:MAG: alpha/beta hydrolase [Myxococcales bacterium]|nr:alpha/beta hydrolase [Myxococcales bacterium]